MTGQTQGRRSPPLYVGLTSAASIAIMAALALYTDTPFVFTALGPTLFVRFYAPHDPTATARNTVAGHAIAIGSALAALGMFGLLDDVSVFGQGLSGERVGAIAVSLALTSALMAATGLVHPPAASTTLTMSLGLVGELWHAGVLEAAVICLVLVTWLLDKLQDGLTRSSLESDPAVASGAPSTALPASAPTSVKGFEPRPDGESGP